VQVRCLVLDREREKLGDIHRSAPDPGAAQRAAVCVFEGRCRHLGKAVIRRAEAAKMHRNGIARFFGSFHRCKCVGDPWEWCANGL
jgi:hypothetical protein